MANADINQAVMKLAPARTKLGLRHGRVMLLTKQVAPGKLSALLTPLRHAHVA